MLFACRLLFISYSLLSTYPIVLQPVILPFNFGKLFGTTLQRWVNHPRLSDGNVVLHQAILEVSCKMEVSQRQEFKKSTCIVQTRKHFPRGTSSPSSTEEAGSQTDSEGDIITESCLEQRILSNTTGQKTAENVSSLSEFCLLQDREEAAFSKTLPRQVQQHLSLSTSTLNRLQVKPKMTSK